MKIATASKKTSKNWKTYDITWEKFLQKLRQPHRTGETMREYRAMDKAGRDAAKEAAGGFVAGALSGPQRKTGNVTERSMITLDADNAKPGAWELATLLCNFRMCSYTTHSHTDAKPRLRWIIPTDRPMTPDEYPAVARRVAEWLDIDTMDATTYELARLMFWPTCSSDGPYVFREQEGPLLRVDDVLHTYGDGEAWKDCNLWPMGAEELTLRKTSDKKAGEPTEKPGMVGLFCRAYDVPSAIAEFLSDVYAPCGNGGGDSRYTYLHGSTAGGAVVYNDGAFLYSNHATDPCGGRSVNAFDLVRIHKFGEQDDVNDCEDVPVTQLPSYRAMVEWCAQLPEIKELLISERTQGMEDAFSDLTEDDSEGQYTDGPDWKKKLTINAKTGQLEPTLNNAILYLRNHPDFKGKFGYNPMSDDITVSGEMPWQKKRTVGKKNSLDSVIEDEKKGGRKDGIWYIDTEGPDFLAYFEKLGYQSRGATNGLLENALKIVALENSYHPIKSYLDELVWDGKPRMETTFIRWLGAEDNELNREITKLWLIAAVDRIVRPGHQFDQILITTGKQGIGKSKLLRLLAKGHFTNSLTGTNMDKKTAELLQDVWIVELGELDSIKKGEQTAVKNFITSTTDRYRAAYAHAAKTYPRICVFAGTSNEGAFLRDNTGERRYWIMPVEGTGDNGELHGFENEVDQIWAETVVMWKQRMKDFWEPGQSQDDVNLYLYLKDPRLDEQMEVRRQGYKLPDEDRTDIEGYLNTPRPDNWEDLPAYERRNFARHEWLGDYSQCHTLVNKVCIKELKYELFDGRSDKALRIGAILDNMPGWKKAKGKRKFKAYADWSQPAWVRIGSEEDY